MYRKTYVEVNLDKLENNIKKILNDYPDYEYYFGCVKGFGYGNGNKIAKYVSVYGINYLTVSSLEEGIKIREYVNNIPILCLEPIAIEFLEKCREYDIAITVSNYDYYLELIKIDFSDLVIHLKINSGMNRLGFKDKKILKEVYDKLKNNVEGIYSHFATNGLNSFCDEQIKNFKEITSLIDLKKIKIIHMGKSETVVQKEKIDFCNGIRLGIVLYCYPEEVGYEEIFSLHSEVIDIQELKENDKVGYDCKYVSSGKEYIAIVPIGYADGFSKRNKNRNVLINNKMYPLVGEVMMGMINVKIDKSVKIGDKVTLIGDTITVKEVSRYLETIVYEVMCMIKNDIPRVYIKNNDIIDVEE